MVRFKPLIWGATNDVIIRVDNWAGQVRRMVLYLNDVIIRERTIVIMFS